MTKNEYRHDMFNTELVKLIRDAESFIRSGGCIHDAMSDLKQDIWRVFDNALLMEVK